MNKRMPSLYFVFLLLTLITSCSTNESLVVVHHQTGPMQTNCYLIYGENGREAALIDVGGRIDTLEAAINKNNLNLRYIFITHAHPDHVQGLPEIRNKYPKAKLCLSKQEYEDLSIYPGWESAFPTLEVNEIKQNPVILELFNFDYGLVGKPDIFIEDNQIYRLGNLNIRTFISPGHSRGSVCYHVGNALFSGDVLFYRRVGRTDMPESGGHEALIKSFRRLYNLLPDNTRVYPGHGPFTDIGSEKKENKRITVDGGELENQ